MIRRFGEVYYAETGLDGFERFKLAHQEGRPFQVIFLDIMMPEMDGHEALLAIRKWEKENLPSKDEVKIVMATALATTKDIISSFRDGCEAYLVKPLTEEAVHKAMDDLGFKPLMCN